MNEINKVPEAFGVGVVGPFQEHRVTCDGYRVPYISTFPLEDGTFHIFVDGRFGTDKPLTREQFDNVIPVLAHAMAVAAGYSSHGEHCQLSNPFKVRMVGVSMPAERPTLTVVDGGKEDV
jgi:hypothetical protein